MSLGGLGTEKRAPALADLDQRPTVEIVRAVVRGHHDVLTAVEAAEPAIAALADAAVERLDAGGRVIYAGTFNKPLFPSLRLAYVVVPPAQVDAFTAARAQADGCPPALSQAVLADFIADGHFGAHLRRMRAVYAERRMTLLDAVGLEAGGRLRLGPSDTGLHVAAFLPSGADDRRVSERAAARGLDAPPLSRYHLEPPSAPGLMLSYATIPPDAIRRGVRTLRQVLDETA